MSDITKEEMERVYNQPKMTGRQAAKELGISREEFKIKFAEFGIKTKIRKSKHPELNDKEWLSREYIDNKKSIYQIAKDINATVGNVNSAINWLNDDLKKGIKLRKGKTKSESIKISLKLKYPDGRFGKDASNWKGGKRTIGAGYVHVYQPNHPYSTKSGYVMQHRLIMEEKICRYLDPDELVHHINEIRDDNRIENLKLMNKSQHQKHHCSPKLRNKSLEIKKARLGAKLKERKEKLNKKIEKMKEKLKLLESKNELLKVTK